MHKENEITKWISTVQDWQKHGRGDFREDLYD
jgi:hypothetical protein